MKFVEKIYPSDANFILIKVKNSYDLQKYLNFNRIIIRNKNDEIHNHVRITVGLKEECEALIKHVKYIDESSK